MVFVVFTSRVGDFECVDTGSGVKMLHYQPWVTAIGNKVYTRSNPKSENAWMKYARAQDLRSLKACMGRIALCFCF